MKIGFMVVGVSIVVFIACASSTQRQAFEQASVPAADSSYNDLSAKEDCVLNYERSCNERNIDRFSELFRGDCEFIYVTGKPSSDADIVPVQTFRKWILQQELKTTGLLFASAQELHFEIERGTWTRLDSLSGIPCADCWETRRAYSLSASFGASGKSGETQAMTGHGHMEFVVSPVDGKWKILKHVDQPMDKQ
jgi:hypothetical protein